MADKGKSAPARPGSPGEHRLQKIHGTVSRAVEFYDRQVLDHLNPEMRQFIARQEMLFIATADGRGECDASIRTGPAGFVQVIDAATLAYPEYRGNGVMASLGNIDENPHIGMIFVDFTGTSIGLHVNGRARILSNAEILERPEPSDAIRKSLRKMSRKDPGAWVWVEVKEAYIHCAKHIPLYRKLDKKIQWGTDQAQAKGGDFFRIQSPPEPDAG